MSRFNHYFANDFASCKLIAYARDNCRGRDVRIFKMPDNVECVGVSDGVDKWIAPVIANPFSIDIIKWMKNHIDGIPNPKPEPPGAPKQGRKRIVLEDEGKPPAIARRPLKLTEEPTPRIRRALLS